MKDVQFKSHEALSLEINEQIDFFKEKAREFLISNFLQSEAISPAVLANKFLASPYKVRRDVISQTMKKRDD